MSEPARYSRTCPQHLTEIVFRPVAHAGSEIPWCYVHDHVPDGWYVQDRDGAVLASAVVYGQPDGDKRYHWIEPYFDVDALLHEVCELAARRCVPAGHSETIDEAVA